MPRIGLMVVLFVSCSFSANAAPMCGDRGGPGYRKGGQCVSWYQLAKGVCCPLSVCTPERLHAGAEKIARFRCKI